MKKKMHYAWIILIGCCALSFVQMGLLTNTNSLFIPFILEGTGMSMTVYTLIIMFQTLLLAVGMAIAGRVIASGRIRLVLLVAGTMEGGAVILRSQAVNTGMWIMAALLWAISSAFLGGLVSQILIANWFSEKTGLAFGILAATAGVGGIVCNPIVGALITSFGWRVAMLLNAVLLLAVVFVLAFFVLRFSPGEGQAPYGAQPGPGDLKEDAEASLTGPSYRKVSKTKAFWFIAIAGSFLAVGLAMQQSFSPQLTEYGYSVSEIALVMSSLMLGTTVSQLVTGILLDRFNNGLVVTIIAILGCAGFAGMIMNGGYAMTIVSAALVGCGAPLMQVALPVIRRTVCGTRSYSQGTATSGAIAALLPAVAMVASGISFDTTRSYNVPYMATIVLFAVSVFLVIHSLVNGYTKKGSELNRMHEQEQEDFRESVEVI